MGFDFPNSPALDEVFTPGEASYAWNGYAWRMTNKTAYPEPILSSLNPNWGYETADTPVSVIGSQLHSTSQILLRDSATLQQTRPVTTFVSDTELTAVFPTLNPTSPFTSSWLVSIETGVLDSPPPAPLFFRILYPVPTALLPTSVAAGSADFVLQVNGQNITDGNEGEPATVILWDGVALPSNAFGGLNVKATITPDATPGTHEVTLQTGALVSQDPPLIFTFT